MQIWILHLLLIENLKFDGHLISFFLSEGSTFLECLKFQGMTASLVLLCVVDVACRYYCFILCICHHCTTLLHWLIWIWCTASLYCYPSDACLHSFCLELVIPKVSTTKPFSFTPSNLTWEITVIMIFRCRTPCIKLLLQKLTSLGKFELNMMRLVYNSF